MIINSLRRQKLSLYRISNGSFLLVFFLLLFIFSDKKSQADDLNAEIKSLEDFSTVYHIIKSRYIQVKNSEDLMFSAMEGMVRGLDPYSDILTQKDLEKLELHSVGQYIGVGVTIQKSGDLFVITQVFKDSPAAAAGIVVGDIIIKIGETILKGKTDEEIRRLLVGDIDTKVSVEIQRGTQEDAVLVKNLKRSLVKANSVECFNQDEKTKVITVFQFLKHSSREIDECMKEDNRSTIILDLRNNPGGLLISAVEAAELFLGIGEVVQIRNRENEVIEKYISRKPLPEDAPRLIVLTNRYSASAAEILAGAIRDRQAGVLIGEQTFGKGVVQTIYKVSNDIYIKITTAHYYTPSAKSFDKVGIQPDIEVSDTEGFTRYNSKDLIFMKALDYAKSKQ
ncbi:S41 family peptidase [bacterium]|nr:S41 family peptidase [bacterium]